jgi:hypothetical protein
LSSSSGAPTGLSEVRWTRTTVGGPNYLGGSVTIWAGARDDISLVGPGTPRSRNADNMNIMAFTSPKC